MEVIVSIPDALEFRRDQYGYTKAKMADELGLCRSHYTEIIQGKRKLPYSAARKAFAIGVPAVVLLAVDTQKP
jgi:antitoxin component HigA of HigAB toxin-antitoxin module